MRTVVHLFALSLITTLGIGTTPEAQAQDGKGLVRKAKFTIVNPTKYTLRYEVQWGNGKWVVTTLKPNESLTHVYDQHNEHPNVHVKFKKIVNAIDEVASQTYLLEPRWVAERNGKVVEGTPRVYRFNVKDSKVDLTGDP